MKTQPNQLIKEKSPYLLQHSDNPVNWYPWGKEAFKKANREDKPIFLSIGYSTCHWCHVMAKESFEDVEIARLINKTFVPVKVDREERPDIDKIYMTVCQLMTGSGGWPLTIFLTPDKKPFFAATYIPKNSKYGRTGLKDLIPKIADLWMEKREKIFSSASEITEALKNTSEDEVQEELTEDILDIACLELKQRYDAEFGGFGTAPKFPLAHNLIFLLHYWNKNKDGQLLNIIERTLRAMREGGIYDQLGFGFHRYSTDKKWHLPHFEKMLYDQALIALAYLETYQVTDNEIYGRTAKEIFTYIENKMLSPEGGFYTAEDADSEGIEGKYYVWEKEEIEDILSTEEAELFIDHYQIDKEGNYREESSSQLTGKNVLHLKNVNLLSGHQFESIMEEARKKLLIIRDKRTPPEKDIKILTSWNGLMIAALARAGWVLDKEKYLEMAVNATNFINEKLRTFDGRLLHRYYKGEASVAGNLNDYSFFIWGLIELYEATFDPQYLKMAMELNKQQLNYFWDRNQGGFYFTPEDSEKILTRQKEIIDVSIPSGNSVSLLNLIRLSHLSGDSKLEDRAVTMGRAFSKKIKKSPSSYSQMLIAIDYLINSFFDVIIVGEKKNKNTVQMFDELRKYYIPNKALSFRFLNKETDVIEIAQFLSDYNEINNKTTAYVCKDYNCQLPTNKAEKMLSLLEIET